ncbi:MAG TPA: FGGY family carbohydrate kinase, partial [Chitinophagaceae bacterium]|nr:FGGY family carbohydrate kinase [Chitinophagaceae bacterium]
MSLPAIAIFDVGKTNKKFLIFDEHYKLLEAESVQLGEMLDEDGFACEDVNEITKWVNRKFSEVIFRKDIDIKAVNFSAYGASFVYVDAKGKVITPMYNYLKPFPDR